MNRGVLGVCWDRTEPVRMTVCTRCGVAQTLPWRPICARGMVGRDERGWASTGGNLDEVVGPGDSVVQMLLVRRPSRTMLSDIDNTTRTGGGRWHPRGT
jgi:hypothetical protein